jgi:hypothetical protein
MNPVQTTERAGFSHPVRLVTQAKRQAPRRRRRLGLSRISVYVRVRGETSMTDEIAEQLAHHLEAANAELARAIQLAQDECSAGEFEIWRDRLATVMGVLVVDVMAPLYRERPSLAPEALRAHYPLRRSD